MNLNTRHSTKNLQHVHGHIKLKKSKSEEKNFLIFRNTNTRNEDRNEMKLEKVINISIFKIKIIKSK